jgi:hypothetical protein
MTVVQNVGNRNVQKRQINDFGGRNVGNGNVQKRQINDFDEQSFICSFGHFHFLHFVHQSHLSVVFRHFYFLHFVHQSHLSFDLAISISYILCTKVIYLSKKCRKTTDKWLWWTKCRKWKCPKLQINDCCTKCRK